MRVNDRFLYFTFNGRHSSEFDLFYINNGGDIVLPFTPVVKYNTVNPLYQNRTYIVGKNTNAKQLKLNVAADRKEMDQIDDIMEWLNPSVKGELSFDHRPDYTHQVYISNITDPTLIPMESRENRIENVIYFEITFETYDTHTSQTRLPYIIPDVLHSDIDILFEPDRLLPIYHRESTLVHQFINWSSTEQYMKITTSATGLNIKREENGVIEVMYGYSGLPIGTVVQIDTEIGALENMGSILENNFRDKEIINRGPLTISPGLIFSGKKQVNVNGTNVRVEIDSRFAPLGGSERVFMQVQNKRDRKITMKPNADTDFWFTGYYEHKGDKLDIPVYAQGTVSYENGKTFLSFSNTELKLKSIEYEIKIAKATSLTIEPIGGITNLEFRYRKER